MSVLTKKSQFTSEFDLKQDNILILSCRGGGGHEATRRAIEGHLSDSYRFHVIYPFDGFKLSKFMDPEKFYDRLLKRGMNRTVNLLASFGPQLLAFGPEPGIIKLVEDAIKKIRPVLVVSLAPIFNKFSMRVCAASNIPYCLVTIDTDLFKWVVGFGKNFKFPKKMAVTIGYDLPETRRCLESCGIESAKIKTIGLAIRKEFFEKKPPREALCDYLRLKNDSKIILIMFGGSGGNRAFEITRLLALQNLKTQLVVITGRNNELGERIKKLPVNVSNTLHVLGFVKNVSDYMRVAHLLITKPGPGTCAEAREMYRQYQTPFVLIDRENHLFWERPNIRVTKDGGYGDDFSSDVELLQKVPLRLELENPSIDRGEILKNEFLSNFSEIVTDLTCVNHDFSLDYLEILTALFAYQEKVLQFCLLCWMANNQGVLNQFLERP